MAPVVVPARSVRARAVSGTEGRDVGARKVEHRVERAGQRLDGGQGRAKRGVRAGGACRPGGAGGPRGTGRTRGTCRPWIALWPLGPRWPRLPLFALRPWGPFCASARKHLLAEAHRNYLAHTRGVSQLAARQSGAESEEGSSISAKSLHLHPRIRPSAPAPDQSTSAHSSAAGSAPACATRPPARSRLSCPHCAISRY